MAIVLGYHTAKHLGMSFGIVWPSVSDLENMFSVTVRGSHSVPTDPYEVLSASLLNNHLLQDEAIPSVPDEFFFYSIEYNRLLIDRFDKLDELEKSDPRFLIASNRNFHDLESAYDGDEFRRFFYSQMLSASVQEQLGSLRGLNLPQKRAAVHIRGGDIVYGDTRLIANFGRLKSISVPMAQEACVRLQAMGYTVLVFGATRSDLNHLSKTVPGVLTADNLGLSANDPATQMILEAAIMSDCDCLVTSEDTAVTKLAELVGKVSLLKVPGWIEEDEEFKLLKRFWCSSEFSQLHVLQQAFILDGLFSAAPTESSIGELAEYAVQAHECDPENPSHILQAYLCQALLGSGEQAQYFARALEQVTGKTTTQFIRWVVESPEQFIQFHGKNILRVLRQLADGNGVNDLVAVEATMLYERYKPAKPPSLLKRVVRKVKRLIISQLSKRG